jgi:hypothetical protein
MKWRRFTGAITALLLISAGTVPAHEPSTGCSPESRDVAHELAVMRSAAIPLSAEPGISGRPRLALDKHYALNLLAHDQVRFTAKPGRAARAASPRGGAFHFEVPAPGRYRISITSRHWIDVVDGGKALDSAAHFGPACDVLHKIVEFDLAAGRVFTLQLSGQDDAIIGLAITATPPAQKQE